MIIRKPYAFLIKYFRQIHIILLFLAGYIYFKITNLHSFVNGYIDTEVYNAQLDSIRNYVSPLLYLAILLLLVGTVVILILLRQKKKPRVTYILICVEYIVLLFLCMASTSYFNHLMGASINSAQIRLIRDFLAIFSLPQFVVFVLLVIRILGIDLQRFGFLEDEEFLQASEEDREEIEVGLNIDKDVYINKIKEQARHFKYYYFENKFILNIIIGIISLILLFFLIQFIFSFKTFKQGKSFYANGYNITINEVYTSIYSSSGNIIEKNKGFIILDMTISNNREKRVLNTDDFVLTNAETTTTPTTKYNQYFNDLGTPYAKGYLNYQGKYRYLLIYRVDEAFLQGKYTLYYTSNARNIKIKIMPKDYSKKQKVIEKKLEDSISVGEDDVIITNMDITTSFQYIYDRCDMNGCSVEQEQINSSSIGYNTRFLELSIDSETYDGYNFSNFLEEHAKVIYKKGIEEKEMNIKNAVSSKYKGSVAYLNVNTDLTNAQEIYLDIHIRNNHYKYKLK